jgi:hypothetical protein
MTQTKHTPETLRSFVDAALAEADERGTVLVSGMSTEEFLAVTLALSDRNLERDASLNEERIASGLPPETRIERLLRASNDLKASKSRRPEGDI